MPLTPDEFYRLLRDLPSFLEQAAHKAEAEVNAWLGTVRREEAAPPETLASRRAPAVKIEPLAKIEGLAPGFEPLIRTQPLVTLETLARVQPLVERDKKGQGGLTEPQTSKLVEVFRTSFEAELRRLIRSRGV